MDVSEEHDEHDDEQSEQRKPPASSTQRKKRSDAGKPRGSRTSSRFERRAKKAAETVRELVRIRMPELDTSELSFVETVDRDADYWGDFLAQVGEWLPAFGVFLDLVFGAALVRVLRVAPSFRAGRRELVAKREQRAARRAAEDEDRELRERIAAEHEQARTEGVFAEIPTELPVEPQQEITREEWLANGGATG